MGEGEKGKLQGPKREKGKLPSQKGKRERGGRRLLNPIPLGNQTARTQARTKRYDFPVEHRPTSDLWRPQDTPKNPKKCQLLLKIVIVVNLKILDIHNLGILGRDERPKIATTHLILS